MTEHRRGRRLVAELGSIFEAAEAAAAPHDGGHRSSSPPAGPAHRPRRVRVLEPPPLAPPHQPPRGTPPKAALRDESPAGGRGGYSREQPGCRSSLTRQPRSPQSPQQAADRKLDDDGSSPLESTSRSQSPEPPPQQLFIYAAHLQKAEGRYELVSGRGLHGLPMWKCGDCVLYSDSHEKWKLTEGDGVRRNVGFLSSGPGPHGGKLPHQVSRWDRFSEGTWQVDPSVSILARRRVHNQSAYIYVIGRKVGRHKCGVCGVACTPGKWFRCNECVEPHDFDLCAVCFEQGRHLEHQFTEMDFESFLPPTFLPPGLASQSQVRSSVGVFAATPETPVPRRGRAAPPAAATSQV